jgi:hypothetical protein
MARSSPDAVVLRGVGVTADDGRSLARALEMEVEVEPGPDLLDLRPGSDFVVQIEQVLAVVLSAGAGATANHAVDGILGWARRRAAEHEEPLKVRIYDARGSVLKEVQIDRPRRRLRLPWRRRRRP